MSNYQPVIGLEVHVELNTKTKMFCRCNADYFGKEPNTQTCPVCLGLPGALPYINEEAINKCIQIGLALNCSINKKNYFERKNYFYPDLAKGFQISQLVLPIAVKGEIEVDPSTGSGLKGTPHKIRVNRVHQEEDTGKLSHIGGVTLVDFNRSGVPLVEIVTEPDFTNSAQIKEYAKKLQQIFRYIGASEADMEKGQMRLEANVSVRKVVLDSALPHPNNNSSSAEVEKYLKKEDLPSYRVELKNINSFRFMVAAVEYEIKRQTDALESGEKLHQETRGWNEDKKETYLQRSKEDAHDYRYFPEPDLPELQISDNLIDRIKSEMPELPVKKSERYVKDLNIRVSDAIQVSENITIASFFEQAVEYGATRNVDPQSIANYIINQKIDLVDSSPDQVVDDIRAKSSGKIEDEAELKKIAKEVTKENPTSVKSYKSGKENAIMTLIGGVMKKTSGKANPQKAREILEKLLR